MESFGTYSRALWVIKPTGGKRNGTAGTVTMTKSVVVNVSRGLSLPSDLSG